MEKLYPTIGLKMIPYGLNRVDVEVPASARLEPKATGVKMMLDTLHRSRLQIPGMGMGYLRRVFDEAVQHARERFVGGTALVDYDQVRARLARLQSFVTGTAAMCMETSGTAGVERDLFSDGLKANAFKTVVTDWMQEAAQSFLQLAGGNGYREDHLAGRALVDSRPYQIFEGSNDILYQQVTESVIKSMRRIKQADLGAFLRTEPLTARAAALFGDALDFDVDWAMPQRKLVDPRPRHQPHRDHGDDHRDGRPRVLVGVGLQHARRDARRGARHPGDVPPRRPDGAGGGRRRPGLAPDRPLVIARPAADEYAPFYHGYVAAVPGDDAGDALTQPALAAALADADPALADHAYAPGKWTLAQVAQHVIDTERLFAGRLLRIARGDQTPLPGFDQDPYVAAATPRPLASLAGELVRLRASTLDLVGSLAPADLARTGTASGRRLSARAAVWIVAGHERHHLRVVRERYLAR